MRDVLHYILHLEEEKVEIFRRGEKCHFFEEWKLERKDRNDEKSENTIPDTFEEKILEAFLSEILDSSR